MTPQLDSSGRIVLSDLPVKVDADGANGITVVSAEVAEKLGLYVPLGAASVRLVAYQPADRGPRARWEPPGRGALGLDAPENGLDKEGQPVGWLAIGGRDVLQGPEDPVPGAYLSVTALQDGRYPLADPRRYFDSAGSPGWVLPGRDLHELGVRIGDLALVEYEGLELWVQGSDEGSPGDLLELSVAACLCLGISADARKGGSKGGARITIYPGSAHLLGCRPATHAAIQEAGRLLSALGEIDR
jgi:hypothetical protein